MRRGGNALVALVQRRQLGEHSIICVGHGEWMNGRKRYTRLRGWERARNNRTVILIDG